MVVKRLLFASLGGVVTFIGVVIADPTGFALPARASGRGHRHGRHLHGGSAGHNRLDAAVIAIVAAILAAAIVVPSGSRGSRRLHHLAALTPGPWAQTPPGFPPL